MIAEEAVVAHFRVIFRCFPAVTEENNVSTLPSRLAQLYSVWLVFRKYRVRILAENRLITELHPDFSQSLQAKAKTVPETDQNRFLIHPA
jgi:hypothetical protein